jgi:antagonist of KipI
LLPGEEGAGAALAAESWRVAAAADRVGVRLDGPGLPPAFRGETLTQGVPWGAIQVPPDGTPIILSADHQTTGGYRVAGVVISADHPVVGQLRPGDEVRFIVIDLAGADRALRASRAALEAGSAALREAAGWEQLVSSAGG